MRRENTIISREERAVLESWVLARAAPRATRARIVLERARGMSPDEVAREVGVTALTVYKWTGRFRRDGLLGLADKPRSGQPRKVSEAQALCLLYRTRRTLPRDGIAWTIRSFARASRVTEHQVRSLWAEAQIEPRRIVAAVDTLRRSGRALVPRCIYLAAEISVGVFETHIRDARGRSDVRAPPFPPSRLKALRAREDGLYTACEVLAADVESDRGVHPRLGELLWRCCAHPPHEPPLHVVRCALAASTEREIERIIEGTNVTVVTMSTLDAWVAAVEAALFELERRHDALAERVRALRNASARFSRTARPANGNVFVWLSSSWARREDEVEAVLE